MKQATVLLTFSVTYNLNGESPETLASHLQSSVQSEIDRDLELMPPESPSDIVDYSMEANVVDKKKKLTFDQIDAWLGSDIKRDDIIKNLLAVANGEYNPETLYSDIASY